MENILKYTISLFSAILSWFAPVQMLVCCAFIFVSFDFVTGVMASRKRELKRSANWSFESAKAWKTIYKLVFVMIGIVLTWLIDTYILGFMSLNLANIFTGFVCGIEFWSYLENAAEISDHPIFRTLKKYMKKQIESKLDV